MNKRPIRKIWIPYYVTLNIQHCEKSCTGDDTATNDMLPCCTMPARSANARTASNAWYLSCATIGIVPQKISVEDLAALHALRRS